jgi:hypothetical protein
MYITTRQSMALRESLRKQYSAYTVHDVQVTRKGWHVHLEVTPDQLADAALANTTPEAACWNPDDSVVSYDVFIHGEHV